MLFPPVNPFAPIVRRKRRMLELGIKGNFIIYQLKPRTDKGSSEPVYTRKQSYLTPPCHKLDKSITPGTSHLRQAYSRLV